MNLPEGSNTWEPMATFQKNKKTKRILYSYMGDNFSKAKGKELRITGGGFAGKNRARQQQESQEEEDIILSSEEDDKVPELASFEQTP
jgi:hypothetical protein